MERHIFISVLLFTLLALALGIFLPSGRHSSDNRDDVPWNVTVDSEGYSHVFGLAIGRAKVADVARKLREPAEVSLFVSADGKRSVEVYFDRAPFGEISAKVVLGVALDEATLQGMYERGLRISSLGGSVRKVELHADDLARVSDSPIASLTYLPATNLDAAVVRGRFGEPAQRLKERQSGLVHWLYPAIGLDLTLNDEGKEVLLYVRPADFEQVVAPLQEKTDPVSGE